MTVILFGVVSRTFANYLHKKIWIVALLLHISENIYLLYPSVTAPCIGCTISQENCDCSRWVKPNL